MFSEQLAESILLLTEGNSVRLLDLSQASPRWFQPPVSALTLWDAYIEGDRIWLVDANGTKMSVLLSELR